MTAHEVKTPLATSSFILVCMDGRTYRIIPDHSKFAKQGNLAPTLERFERSVRDAVALKPNITNINALKELVFSHISKRAAPGQPDCGPPIEFILKDFATIIELQPNETAPTSR